MVENKYVLLARPPQLKTIIGLTPNYTGIVKQAPAVIKAPTGLRPFIFKVETLSFPNVSDHLDFASARGYIPSAPVLFLALGPQ